MPITPAEPRPPTLRLASTGTLTHGLTVGEVLGVSTLADARLIAGGSGLDRVVQRLNVMEVPDILAWVKPHELLLTTGYPLRNTPQSLGRLVADLDERGLAALAIKLGRYLDGLPAEMIEQADRLGFPLIVLPNDVGFDDILNQVLTDILNRQAAILARGEEVHRALVQIVLGGGGLQEVTDEVACLLDAAVMAADGDGRMLVSSGAEHHLSAMRAACLDSGGRLMPMPDLGGQGDQAAVPVVAAGFEYGRIAAFSAAGTLRAADVSVLERAATVAALVITKQQAVAAVESKYRADFIRDVLAGRAGSAERVTAHSAGFGWDLDRDVAVVVAELDPEPRAAGRPARRGQDRGDNRADHRNEHRNEHRNDHRGDHRNDHRGDHRGELRELRVPEPRSPEPRGPESRGPEGRGADGRGAEPRSRGGDERAAQDRLATAWSTAVRRRDPKAAVASFSHEVVAIVGVPADGDVSALVKDVTSVFADHPGTRCTFSTGVSRVVSSPDALPEAYEQAGKAVRVGRQLHGLGAVAHFDQLGVYRLLSLVPDTAELRAFVHETLGDLAGDDDPEAVDLRRTLQVLLETNLNVAETARRLHFHYNTLRYRIGKLERLLGPFTEDAHLRLNLTLALHVLRMRGI